MLSSHFSMSWCFPVFFSVPMSLDLFRGFSLRPKYMYLIPIATFSHYVCSRFGTAMALVAYPLNLWSQRRSIAVRMEQKALSRFIIYGRQSSLHWPGLGAPLSIYLEGALYNLIK